MVRLRKFFAICLVAVYAFFFASTNLCYHTHQLPNSILVHSHPFSGAGHTHTANQILLIDTIDSAIYQESVIQSVPEYVPIVFNRELSFSYSAPVISAAVSLFSLRAPPESC